MAGIYFHIPFCKQACHYCDFHFSTSHKYKTKMLIAMKQELKLRKGYLNNESIETIYFGGGTPSILQVDEIKNLIQIVYESFHVTKEVEITLEANPDDLSMEKIKMLKNSPINRLSIGVQSFFEEDLIWMNRAHHAIEAENAVKLSQDAGLTNINIDLIYGYQLLTDEKWVQNLQKIFDLKTPHLSAYSMTVEPRTVLASYIKKGFEKPLNENHSTRQFSILCEHTEKNGLEQYEISNFSYPKQYAKHNTNYWRGIPYLGIGPSAHSFNKKQRQWNIRNNQVYINTLSKNQLPTTIENLSISNRINEYIMTALRTKWGLDLQFLIENFGANQTNEIQITANPFLKDGKLSQKQNIITLTQEGKLFADYIAAELFVD